jgi:hypothetical protein
LPGGAEKMSKLKNNKINLLNVLAEVWQRITLGRFSKQNTLLGGCLWESNVEDIRDRKHITSVAFLVNVAKVNFVGTGRPLAVRL